MDRRSLISPKDPARLTVALTAAVVVGWLAGWAATVSGWLSPVQGCAVNTLWAYLAFTPLHEACHKNVQGGTASWQPVETVAGYLSGALLLVPFPLFRVQHLRHHSFVNDPEKDPDYWARGPVGPGLLARILTILPGHYVHFLRTPTDRGWALVPNTLGVNGLLLMLLMKTGWRFGWWAPALLWVVPAVLALALLALTFDWLPHHPHDDTSRYGNATVFTAPWLDVLLLGQNYHLMHHLYPRIPFYRYKAAFHEFRDDLEKHGAKIR